MLLSNISLAPTHLVFIHLLQLQLEDSLQHVGVACTRGEVPCSRMTKLHPHHLQAEIAKKLDLV
jgi:hypothetical protein